MAGKATKFVQQPTDKEQAQLEHLWQQADQAVLQFRAHAVLLSAKGYSIAQLSDIFDVERHTVSHWIDRWNRDRLQGLSDAPRPNREPILDEAESKTAVDLLTKFPRQPKRVLQEITKQTGKTISRKTLYRIAHRAGLSWKRARRSPNPPPEDEAVSRTEKKISELKQREQQGEIELFAFDEARFAMKPEVPYAWQPEQRIELPSAQHGSVSALAFVSTDGETVPYSTEDNVNSEIVIHVFDNFCKQLKRETWVILDNATPHTSRAFEAKIEEWASRGLHVYHQAPRCPRLNWAEGLWRRIRYHWLPLDATESLSRLRQSVDDVLTEIGKTFHYNPGVPSYA